VTLPGYCLALSILLGSLVLLVAGSYAMLRLKPRRQVADPRRQEP
jgi:hypothetical protein